MQNPHHLRWIWYVSTLFSRLKHMLYRYVHFVNITVHVTHSCCKFQERDQYLCALLICTSSTYGTNIFINAEMSRSQFMKKIYSAPVSWMRRVVPVVTELSPTIILTCMLNECLYFTSIPPGYQFCLVLGEWRKRCRSKLYRRMLEFTNFLDLSTIPTVTFNCSHVNDQQAFMFMLNCNALNNLLY